MTDHRYVEKSFLYLLAFSLLLHVAVFAVFYYMPTQQPQAAKEPVFVDLQNVPELKQVEKPKQKEVPRISDQQVRVEREMAPRGDDHRDRPSASPQPVRPPVQPRVQSRVQQNQPRQPRPATPLNQPTSAVPSENNKLPLPPPANRRESQVPAGSSVSSLLKPRQQSQTTRQQLFPGSSRMAKLEENYRRKFENDIAEGDTRFLNTDDIQFGSFLRRFENSVYGVWRYPAEAARNGIEGITPVKITFNRNGEIIHVQQLETSGSKILDDEVLRTLRSIGPVGSFPKGYDKEEFNLIAFFQYGGARRALR